MAEFILDAKITISITTTVEAESLEEAIVLAEDRNIETYQFGDDNQALEYWISEDFDGVPYNIKETKDD